LRQDLPHLPNSMEQDGYCTCFFSRACFGVMLL
jgi:hypothetical protein